MFRPVTLLALTCTLAASAQELSMVTSTATAPWTRAAAPTLLPPQRAYRLEVTEIREQKMRGWGGCFNELGWVALQALPEARRAEVLANLYGPAGLGFTLGRLPIGANDYSVDFYSHDETKDDFALKHFSLERDHQRLIPFIRAAKVLEPKLTLWASPWCPPSWMKTNGHYACNPSEKYNDLKPEGRGGEMRTQFRMEPPVLQAYASYFSRFVQEYARLGLPISAVHVQNEFNSCQVFPSCVWEPKDLATFIGRYLGPTFAKDGLATEIWLGTIERPQFERVSAILNDPEAKKYIKGAGFQWAGKEGIGLIHRQYPHLSLVQTETECGDGENSWKDAEYTYGLMKHYLDRGAETHMAWNMVLEKGGVSRWGWVQNSLVTVDTAKGTVTYNPEYYVFRHLSAFVKPGAHKLATTGEDAEVLAFRNPDGGVVVVLGNASDNPKPLKARIHGQDVELSLLPRSFNTLLLTQKSVRSN